MVLIEEPDMVLIAELDHCHVRDLSGQVEEFYAVGLKPTPLFGLHVVDAAQIDEVNTIDRWMLQHLPNRSSF